jgi:hypothetical protein
MSRAYTGSRAVAPPSRHGEEVQADGAEHDLVAPGVGQPLLHQLPPRAGLDLGLGVLADQQQGDHRDQVQRERGT